MQIYIHSSSLIGVLTALILALGYDSRGEVRASDCAIRAVDMLATSATRPVSIDSDVFLIYVEFSRHFWHHYDTRCARMDPALFIRLWDPLHPILPYT